MELNELYTHFLNLQTEIKHYGGHFDFAAKEKEIEALENMIADPNFWNDKKQSEEVIEKLNAIKGMYTKTKELKQTLTNHVETLELLKEEYDGELKELIEEELPSLEEKVESLKLNLLLNGPYDNNGAMVEIHAGAGGTESCDWAGMLYRMYLRWCEKKGYKVEILSEVFGEEAGYKSVFFLVKGSLAYGYLKNEKGVHRLIRLSPFDSNNRRHTSFASLEITPIFDNSKIDIEINDADLRIDVYRSSGHGGQGVNTTDSAVRITHIPTKIVVTCQNERSQIKNKETAMGVLKNKLYELELEKQKENIDRIKGTSMENGFGSQIRTYVMHPYAMVKDHRTGTENSNVAKVLDGDIDLFISENLKKGS
ncbi:MAG: peptide chain release factor 2 [Bacilli bacterium]|nr:peptide chain release factor 2 [Bacilli bacterium]